MNLFRSQEGYIINQRNERVSPSGEKITDSEGNVIKGKKASATPLSDEEVNHYDEEGMMLEEVIAETETADAPIDGAPRRMTDIVVQFAGSSPPPAPWLKEKLDSGDDFHMFHIGTFETPQGGFIDATISDDMNKDMTPGQYCRIDYEVQIANRTRWISKRTGKTGTHKRSGNMVVGVKSATQRLFNESAKKVKAKELISNAGTYKKLADGLGVSIKDLPDSFFA